MRIGPIVSALREETDKGLRRWQVLTESGIRLDPIRDNESLIEAGEDLVDFANTLGEPDLLIWAAKAAIAMHSAIPSAWLVLLKNGQHEKKEWLRLVNCVRGARDVAIGDQFQLPQITKGNIVRTMDTYLEAFEWEAAGLDHEGDKDGANLMREAAIKSVAARVPRETMAKSSRISSTPTARVL